MLMHKSNNIYTGLCSENYRMLMKIKGLNKWRDMFMDWYNTDMLSMSVLPRVIYLFNTIPIKSLEIFLVNMEEIILNLYVKIKEISS